MFIRFRIDRSMSLKKKIIWVCVITSYSIHYTKLYEAAVCTLRDAPVRVPLRGASMGGSKRLSKREKRIGPSAAASPRWMLIRSISLAGAVRTSR